jgi:hypothetical protein
MNKHHEIFRSINNDDDDDDDDDDGQYNDDDDDSGTCLTIETSLLSIICTSSDKDNDDYVKDDDDITFEFFGPVPLFSLGYVCHELGMLLISRNDSIIIVSNSSITNCIDINSLSKRYRYSI